MFIGSIKGMLKLSKIFFNVSLNLSFIFNFGFSI